MVWKSSKWNSFRKWFEYTAVTTAARQAKMRRVLLRAARKYEIPLNRKIREKQECLDRNLCHHHVHGEHPRQERDQRIRNANVRDRQQQVPRQRSVVLRPGVKNRP